jgi:hypothetical protein
MTFYGDLTPEPSREAGGGGMWGRLVPYAWQLLQDPRGDSPVPECPRPQKEGADSPQIAWWSPLLQLLFYGLGWPRPELGIRHWIDAGSPTDDDVLRLVNRWWGARAGYIAAWAAEFGPLEQAGQRIHAAVGGTHYYGGPLDDRWDRIRATEDYRQAFGGGGDSMHLTYHCETAIASNDPNLPRQRLLRPSESNHSLPLVLVVENYEGWYQMLSTVPPKQTPDGRSQKVDVFCTKVGFLGTYRYSRDTGRWFRGQHRWHLMGANLS